MASEALIAAHNNPFNKAVLNSDAFYFSDSTEVRQIVETVQRDEAGTRMVQNNLQKIQFQFNWENIIDQYEEFIIDCYYHLNYAKAFAH